LAGNRLFRGLDKILVNLKKAWSGSSEMEVFMGLSAQKPHFPQSAREMGPIYDEWQTG